MSRKEMKGNIFKMPALEDIEMQEAGQSIVRILYQVMEPYHYSEEDVMHFIRGFRSAGHGFVSLEEAGRSQRVNNSYIKRLDTPPRINDRIR